MSVPLARDQDGHPFAPPREAIAWRVYTRGRPRRRLVWTTLGPLHIEIAADVDDLRRWLAEARIDRGRFELVPVDEGGAALSPSAYARVDASPEVSHG